MGSGTRVGEGGSCPILLPVDEVAPELEPNIIDEITHLEALENYKGQCKLGDCHCAHPAHFYVADPLRGGAAVACVPSGVSLDFLRVMISGDLAAQGLQPGPY